MLWGHLWRPGFKGFRRFCLPLAGGFKGYGIAFGDEYKDGVTGFPFPPPTVLLHFVQDDGGRREGFKRFKGWWYLPIGRRISDAAFSGFRCEAALILAPKAPTSPAQRYFITTLGGALKLPVRRSRSQAEPLVPRGASPEGAINPQPRSGCQPSGIQPSANNVSIGNSFSSCNWRPYPQCPGTPRTSG